MGDELGEHEDADGEDGEEVDGYCPAVPAGAVAVVEPVGGEMERERMASRRT